VAQMTTRILARPVSGWYFCESLARRSFPAPRRT
jgi:hypothetical protein